MRKTVLWIAVALALIAIPAVVGLVALKGDDDSRRSGALVALGKGVGYQLVIQGLTPPGKAIDVESFSWGIANAGAADRSGLSAGKAQLHDLVITKKLDQTSPLLANSVATGKHHTSAVLTLYKQDPAKGLAVKFATYTLTDVLIGNAQHSGGSPEIPSESISLNYGKLDAEISTVDAAGVSPPEKASFDLSLLAQ